MIVVFIWLAVALLAPAMLRAELAQVHVDHSVTARDLLVRCDQAARTDPTQAIALLAELLEHHADELVEVAPGEYLAAGLVARRQVNQWPAPALQQLRETWEPLAGEQWQLLADSPEAGEIERFARRYFITSAGAQAVERAARLALEAGQVDLARLHMEDLLAYHPQRQQMAIPWGMLLAAGLRLRGDEPASRQAMQAAQSQPMPAPESWPVLERLQALKPLPATSRPTGTLDEKTKFAVLWQANLTDRASYRLNRQKMQPHWLPQPVVPAQPDLIITQWDRHCFAFDPASGKMVWDYYPLSEKMAARAGITGPTMPRRPVVAGGRVYAVSDVPLPQDKPGPAAAIQALACLDVATGRPYWVRGAGEMMSREVPTILDGTPIVADGRVYLAARIARTAAYNEVFVLQVDARSGELLGRTHLFGLGRVEQTPNERIKPTRLGVRGGILYVISPAGAAGALDANSLKPIWVHSFKAQAVTDARDADVPEVREPNVPALWSDEPLIAGDTLVVPADASLQVLDRLRGQERCSIVLDGPVQALSVQPDSPNQVAAIAKRGLYIADIAKGTIVHKFDLGRPAEAVGGLCPLSGGRLLICMEDLLRVVQRDGLARDMPVDLLAAGIPTVAGERLYLGTNGYLACVADGTRPLADLQQKMTTSDSPLAALQAGELALRTGRSDLAIQSLRAAVQRGGTDVSRAGETAVRQLFETCLTFAREYGRKQGVDAQRVTEQLLDIARQCPSPPEDKLEVYAIQTDLQLAQKKPTEAIAGLQAVLADKTLRSTPLPDSLGGRGILAGEWAQSHIDKTIQRFGPQAYRPFDEEAARLLQAGQKSGDRKPLDDLLQRYPNSKHVPAALLSIGQALARTGDTRAALEPLRMAATLPAGDPATQRQAMLHLAQAYEKLGNGQAAATWMARLASQAADMRLERAGHSVTVKQYADELASRLPHSPEPTCRIDLPLRPAGSQTLEDSVVLLSGPHASTDAGERRIAPAWSASCLRAFDLQTGQPTWKQPLAFKTQPSLLASEAGCLILYDHYRVTAIHPANGQILWTWAGPGPDPRGPNVDPESVPTIQAAVATAASILVFTADGQATCLNRSTGAPRWQRQPQPVFVAGLAVSEELAVYRAAQANRVVYRVLDVATGQDVSVWQPARDVPAESVEVLPGAMVMLQGTNMIEAYDAYSGKLAWQVPARGRFHSAISLRRDTTFYIADGERQLVKIDTLTGQIAWRAMTPARTGTSVCLLAAGPLLWLVDERGVHLIDDATGKTLQTAMLPEEVGANVLIRNAAVCDKGVLCLAIKRRGENTKTPPAVVTLFACKDKVVTALLAARLEEASGLISSWDVSDNAVLIATGNRIITLRSKGTANR